MNKFVHGMKNPKYFFNVLNGIIKGGKNAKLLKKAPLKYDKEEIGKWQKEILKNVINVTRK